MGFWLLDHPNPEGPHYYTTRNRCQHDLVGPHVIVLHTAENLPDWTGADSGAQAVANLASRTIRRVSWHQTVDSDSIIPTLPDDYTAWHVRGYNRCSLGVEMATQADSWLESPYPWRLRLLHNCARVLADWSATHAIPARLITRAEVDAGAYGVTFHSRLDPDRRRDPGRSFPHPYLLSATQILLGQRVVTTAPSGTAVLGLAVATRSQAAAFVRTGAARRGSPYSDQVLAGIVKAYYELGAEEGVRADLALAQACKETGYFSYGGDVHAEQWNFAGIGATGGVPGNTFPSMRAGVHAHLRRMRLYASTGPVSLHDLAILGRPLPSRHWGHYSSIEDFDGVWAVPGVGYGRSIVDKYLAHMLAMADVSVIHPLDGLPADLKVSVALLRQVLDHHGL